jgi:choline dehydrogenase-like flavoprotein
MLQDSQEFVSKAPLLADVCIVGAGAVGIALALALKDAGRDVILLEAGGPQHEAEAQAFYRGAVVDPLRHRPLDQFRERRLGGTTTVWSGRCMPFDPIDFEAREWMQESGWPIAYEAVARYYPQANKLCEAGAFAYTAKSAFPEPIRPMIRGYDGEAFTTELLERFSLPTDFGQRYRERLANAANVKLILHASVADISLDESGTTVVALDARTRSGDSFSVQAKQFVLAAGGLESTRLLLASRRVQRNGIGNEHDVLGRYYMCHLAGTMGSFHPSAGRDAVWNGYEIAADGTYCRRRLALLAHAQREHRIGNFIARLHHPRIADPAHGSGVLSALHLGKGGIAPQYRLRLEESKMELGEFARHAMNVVRGAPDIARFAAHMLVRRRLAARKYPSVVIRARSNRYSLDFHAEQEPNPLSRVRLGSELDPVGMPRLEVDWRYTSKDVETVATSLKLFAAEVRASGCGTFAYHPDEVEREMTRYGAYAGHHIGTARMGDDPKRSVVDADCRVHGMNNLSVAGSAVFPTSSQANPTLTAVALALRLADRLKARMDARPDATMAS